MILLKSGKFIVDMTSMNVEDLAGKFKRKIRGSP